MKVIKNKKIYTYLLLQIAFFIYSLSAFFSKFSTYNNDNIKTILLYYSFSLIALGMYAIIWQQVLKRMPLSIAFANKGITIIWGLILGKVIFNEQITIGKIIGAMIVIFGIVIIMRDGKEQEED